MAVQGDVFARGVHAWSDIPTALLQAELAKRQDATAPAKPECGTKKRGSYDTPLHVGALILILTLSTLACAFPIIARRFPKLPIPHQAIFLSRHFGTGVLIATAFVHLFPTAYISLTDPCLPYFWNTRYPAMPGLVAMLSVLTVVGIEMFFAMRGAGHVHGTDFDVFGGEDEALEGRQRSGSVKRYRDSDSRLSAIHLGPLQGSSSENLMAGRSPSLGHPSPLPPTVRKSTDSNASSDDGLDLDELLQEQAPDSGLLNGTTKRSEHNDDTGDLDDAHLHHNHEPITTATQASHQKALLQCLLLEAGILFHSVFIGMAVSVSTGPPFAVLLVAICFHQTFEGLALGARIGALAFPPSSPKPWLMALAYGTTTPIGQAIGLAIHNLYDPQSATGLLTVGIMNAISSGLLLFAGMVELLAEDFLSDQSYKTLRGKRRYQACGAVVAGALLMAFVGAWA